MKPWKMTADAFYDILENVQDFKCAYTGRELRPANTTIALKTPIKDGGKSEKSNIELVDSDLTKLARQMSRDKIIDLAYEILSHCGKERGYEINKI